jgi:hypothetical protein
MFGIQAYALMQGKFWCSVTLTYLVQNPRSASRLQDVQFDKASSMESLNSKASTQKLGRAGLQGDFVKNWPAEHVHAVLPSALSDHVYFILSTHGLAQYPSYRYHV